MARQNTPGPAPEVVREFRITAGLTQAQAGALVHVEPRTWEKWEKPAGNPEHRQIPMAHFELFCMKLALFTA